MPRGDGTGPMGMGPMTGRRMGVCTGYATPGYAGAEPGMGSGRGFRRMYYVTGLPGWARCGKRSVVSASYEYEKEALEKQAEYLEKQLKQVREQLKTCN